MRKLFTPKKGIGKRGLFTDFARMATATKTKEKTASSGVGLAVIETGGKQYTVEKGSVLMIEKIKGEHKVGDLVVFDKILLVDNGTDTTLGTPYVKGVTVKAKIEDIGKGKKIEVVKYKQKSRYLKTRGHRQPYFKVSITSL